MMFSKSLSQTPQQALGIIVGNSGRGTLPPRAPSGAGRGHRRHCHHLMTDSMTDAQFRDEARLTDAELASPASSASALPQSPQTPLSATRGLSSPATDALSPAQAKKREAIRRKKEAAKKKKAAKKEVAERERKEAEAAAHRAEVEEGEARAADEDAAKEAADVGAAEAALAEARAGGDAATIAAAEQRLAEEQAQAAAAAERAVEERQQARLAREEAAREAAEASAAEAALSNEDKDQVTIQAEVERDARHSQAVRDAAAQSRSAQIQQLRKAELKTEKAASAENKTASKAKDKLDHINVRLKSLRSKISSTERAHAEAQAAGDSAATAKLRPKLEAANEAAVPVHEEQAAAKEEADDTAAASNEATDAAAEAKKAREAAEKEHAKLNKQGEADAEAELKTRLSSGYEREEARVKAQDDEDEALIDAEDEKKSESLQTRHDNAKQERDLKISELRREENDVANIAATEAATAQGLRDAHGEVAAELKDMQAKVAAAKKAVKAAHGQANNDDGIAAADSALTEAQAEMEPVAEREAVAKAAWGAAEQVSQGAAATAAKVKQAREVAEREDAKLVKQGEKEAVAVEKQRQSEKSGREKDRAKQRAGRDSKRNKDYATKKKAEKAAAAAAAAQASAHRESRDVERAYRALIRAKEDGDLGKIAAAQDRLKIEKAEAAVANRKAAKEKATAAAAAKEAATVEKVRLKAEKAASKVRRQEQKELARKKRDERTAKEVAEANAAKVRAEKENRDVEDAEEALMKARRIWPKNDEKIAEAQRNLDKETKEAFVAMLDLDREREEAIAVWQETEDEAVQRAEDAEEKSKEKKANLARAEAKLKKEKDDVAAAERKLAEVIAGGDADATKEAEEDLKVEQAEAAVAELEAKEEARQAQDAVTEAALVAKDSADEAAAARDERVTAEKQRYKLHRLETKLREDRRKHEDERQRKSLKKLGQYLRGKGYTQHLHSVADALQTHGTSRAGWVTELEAMSAEDFEDFMAPIHGDEQWRETQAAIRTPEPRRAPARKQGGHSCCAASGEAEKARRRAHKEVAEAAKAQAKHDKEWGDVEAAERALAEARESGDLKAMCEAGGRLEKEKKEHAEAEADMEKERLEAEEAQADFETLVPTKSLIEPVVVAAHGRELEGRVKPDPPRLIRADSAEEMYGQPRVLHRGKAWENPSVKGRQWVEREKAELLSKSMEDSEANETSIVSKDGGYDDYVEQTDADDEDLLDLTGVSEPKRRGITVTVMSCRDLPKADLFGETDPYVVVKVEDESSRKTPTVDEGGSDPIWGEGEGGRLGTFYPELVGFPVIKVKAYDEDIGPGSLADDLLGKCEIDMGRLKVPLYELWSKRCWWPLRLKGKDCGAVELLIEWDPYPPEGPLDADLLARKARTFKTSVYRPHSMVDLEAKLGLGELGQTMCGLWRARGTLAENIPTASSRISASFSSQAWLETVGQELEEFVLTVINGRVKGKALKHRETDNDHFTLSGTVDSLEASQGGSVSAQWRISMQQLYTNTGNATEWSATMTSDGKGMEFGRWSGDGINGEFSAVHLLEGESFSMAEESPMSQGADFSHSRTFSPRSRRTMSAQEELAAGERKVADAEDEFGNDHEHTLQARLELANVMDDHGNHEGHALLVEMVERSMEAQEVADRWRAPREVSVIQGSSVIDAGSPAPSAAARSRPGMGEFANTPSGIHLSPATDRQQAARRQGAVATPQPEPEPENLTLSPMTEAEAARELTAQPDHIEAMLGSPTGTSPEAASVSQAPPLEDLLGPDDSPEQAAYRGGDV